MGKKRKANKMPFARCKKCGVHYLRPYGHKCKLDLDVYVKE
jgi:uncharacterized OB-fold protein